MSDVTNKNINFSMEQLAAIDLCLDQDELIVGITGGAGTGKTTILKETYNRLTEQGIMTALVAPTGRAAKRIQELTGIKARTIHRLLQFPMPDDEIKDNAPANEPRRNRYNPIDEQCVIVDESSMIGPTLYQQLLAAMPSRKQFVRFFGDNNQLPPVEEGLPPFVKVLKEKPSVTLTYNYRSNDEIVGNALRILQGSIPIRNPRFQIIYTSDPIRAALEMVDETITRPDTQIITPTRKGKLGSARLNPSLQHKFNPTGDYLRLNRLDEKEAAITVRTQDKFIWVKNAYDLALFNGEIGRINRLDQESGELWLALDDKSEDVHVPPLMQAKGRYGVFHYDPRKMIELGYAITTHKSQGSEFDTIIYVMSSGAPFLLNRNNLYTAVTRARHQVIIVCDSRAMTYSVRKRAN